MHLLETTILDLILNITLLDSPELEEVQSELYNLAGPWG